MPRSVMEHKFADLPNVNIPRSSFDRSHSYRTTFDSGLLVPIYCDEVLPGDTHVCNGNIFARMATPIHPVMDNMYLDTQFFFVPYRLVWENWEKLCGAQDDPDDSIDYLVPTVASLSTGYVEGSIFDYLGLPTKVTVSYNHSALPLRAYNLIWNDWYRDQNLQDSAVVNVDDGPDNYGNFPLRRRGKRHDYFTSCAPWPQKGGLAVAMPIGDTAPIVGIGSNDGSPTISNINPRDSSGTIMNYPHAKRFNTDTTYFKFTGAGPNDYPEIYTDLSAATGSTVNELRQAITIQQMLERDARSGTRYPEVLLAHFGVVSPDFRLQRPEYIGGGSSPVQVTSVPQTAETGTTPQGNLAAYGVVAGSGHGFTYSATEHGVILGMASVRADLTYQKGMHRSWSRRTRYDFYWPDFAKLGEQAVLSKEIYVDSNSNDNETVFGYQEAWSDYRFKQSLVTGLFRSNASGSLDVWHLSQDFASRPTLSGTFIEDNPPISRVVAVPSEPEFIMDAYFNLTSVRPMPVYGIPGLTRF